MNPLISIVVPVYNVEDYLEKCLNSIINQDLKSYEVILVNDGSTDKSGDICDTYSQKYSAIKVIHTKNRGQSAARNKGIIESRGEYLFFLDSDDYYIERSISKFQEVITKDRSVDLVLGKINTFYEGTDKVHSKTSYKNILKVNGLDGESALRYLVKTNQFVISPYSFMVKRKLLIDNKVFFREDLRCAEDIIFTPKIYFLANHVRAIEGYFVMYRKNRVGQITQKFNPSKGNIVLEIFDNWIKDVDTWNINSSTKKMFKRYIGNLYVSSLGKHKLPISNGENCEKYLIENYTHLIRYCGGKRYNFFKIVYYLFGLKATMYITRTAKKMYDYVKLLK